MNNSVNEYLQKNLKEGPSLFVLVDPDEISSENAVKVSRKSKELGVDSLMVGGSLGAEGALVGKISSALKKGSDLPVILFPGSSGGVSDKADAIFFMSLLNSRDPHYIIGSQAQGAPIIKEYGIETLSLGYLVVEPGKAVGWVGDAKPFPKDKPEIISAYALAAQYFGMNYVYLEAGSGAESPVPTNIIKAVRKAVEIPIIVGGGIKTGKQAKKIVNSGANAIVTGTAIEEDLNNIKRLSKAIK